MANKDDFDPTHMILDAGGQVMGGIVKSLFPSRRASRPVSPREHRSDDKADRPKHAELDDDYDDDDIDGYNESAYSDCGPAPKPSEPLTYAAPTEPVAVPTPIRRPTVETPQPAVKQTIAPKTRDSPGMSATLVLVVTLGILLVYYSSSNIQRDSQTAPQAAAKNIPLAATNRESVAPAAPQAPTADPPSAGEPMASGPETAAESSQALAPVASEVASTLEIAPPVKTPSPPAGLSLLDRAQLAMGGRERLAAIRDSTSVSRVLYPDGQEARAISKFIFPGHKRQELSLFSGGRRVTYTDGSAGWISTPTGLTSMSVQVIQDLVFYDLAYLVGAERNSLLTIRSGAGDAVQIDSNTGQTGTLRFDPSSGLPSSLSYPFVGNNSEKLPATAFFSDWREVGGIKVPFKMIIEVNGRLVRTDFVVNARVNTGIGIAEISATP